MPIGVYQHKKGFHLSEETKEKLRQINLGRKHTEETKEKMSKAHKGKIVSEEHRRKISEAKKGERHSKEHRRKNSESHLGLKYPNRKKLSLENRQKMSERRRGKKYTEETKTKMSKIAKEKGFGKWTLGRKLSKKQRRKLSKLYKGKKCRFWEGGKTKQNQLIRHSVEFRLWREAVFARDNWTCQKTGIKGGKLHPHHIQNFAQFPELRFAIDNGITLSKEAHIEFHKIYGKKNNTKEQIEEFLKKPSGFAE